MPIPIVVDPTSAQVGTTLPVIRHELLASLGYFATGTVTSEADSLEADRYVVSDDIRSDQSPPEELDGLYLYVLNGDEARSQRRVMNGQFEGTYGAVMVDRSYETGALPVGTAFELGVLPARSYLGVTGAHDCINLGLRMLSLIDYVSVTIVADQSEYPFIGYPWPIKGIHSVVYSRTSTTNELRYDVPRGSWSFVQNAESPVLSFGSVPASAGQVVEVGVLRPAHTRIKRNGAWADSTVGLALEDDETLYDAQTVVNVARPIALQRLAQRFPRGSKERMDLEAEADIGEVRGAIARFYGSFRGDGRQSAMTGGGSRSWGKSWTP